MQNIFIDVLIIVHQISNCHIKAVMNNHKFIILDNLAAKKSGMLDWRRDFCDCSLQTSYRVQNTYGHRSAHAHSTLINRLKPWCSIEQALCSTSYAMPMCDVIIVSMISWLLHRLEAIVIIILNIHWWSWALMLHLKADESLIKSSQCTYSTEKCRLQDVKRADFIQYWQRSGLKNPGKLKIFTKKNIRNHSYHQFYPVLAKIWIKRIRINQSLLYIYDVASFHC